MLSLRINGDTYSLPESDARGLVELVQNMALTEYAKLDDNWQFLSKPIALTILRKMEEEAKKKGAAKEQYLAFRPAKRQDPTEHLLKIMSGLFYEAIRHVELRITTNGDSISSFACEVLHQGEGGGPLVTHGHERIREDNGVEVSGRGLHAPISNDEALCP